MEKDETLKDLYAQQEMLKIKIQLKKRGIAKKEGKVVDSIEELVCENHPNASFEIVGKIENSRCKYNPETKEFEELNMYHCKECGEDKIIYHFNKSKAYECPNCGIVIGEYDTVPYRSSEESWGALAGREGEHYHCKICNTQLGYKYWLFS